MEKTILVQVDVEALVRRLLLHDLLTMLLIRPRIRGEMPDADVDVTVGHLGFRLMLAQKGVWQDISNPIRGQGPQVPRTLGGGSIQVGASQLFNCL